MSDLEGVKQFPKLSTKLAAPKKGSLFERQRAEAEAKRLREEAETAAVYNDFVKSFEDDDEPAALSDGSASGHGRPNALKTGAKRHFSSAVRKSGPGTLGPAPSVGRKRASDDQHHARPAHRAFFGGHDSDSGNERESSRGAAPAISRPTMQMSSLPPGTSPAVIKNLLPSELKVEDTRITRMADDHLSRSSDSAIITFSADTPHGKIDAAVSLLQGRYLGHGFNLSLSRHLSSTTISSVASARTSTARESLPFGAKSINPNRPSNRGGAFEDRRFAPPDSYGKAPERSTQVNIKPPASLTKLRLIHKTVEAVVTNGPEFEALLMSNPSIQRDEKWAFLWNARSSDGVWYRWQLWKCLSGIHEASRINKARLVFEEGPPWMESDGCNLPFEFTTRFEGLMNDSDYDSSDEEDSGDENGMPRRLTRKGKNAQSSSSIPDKFDVAEQDGLTCLNPLQKGKLIHLLTRLPTSSARLRRGDVARITALAMVHSGTAADEVAELIIANAVSPFALTAKSSSADESEDAPDADGGNNHKRREDDSSATLVGLHVVSDLLAAPSTSGVRHSWKYRQLVHSLLQKYEVFKTLGRIERDLLRHAGRIRADKWRRSILQGVLALWEKRGTFMENEVKLMNEEYEKGTISSPVSTPISAPISAPVSAPVSAQEHEPAFVPISAQEHPQRYVSGAAKAPDSGTASVGNLHQAGMSEEASHEASADGALDQEAKLSGKPVQAFKMAPSNGKPGASRPAPQRPRAVDMMDSD